MLTVHATTGTGLFLGATDKIWEKIASEIKKKIEAYYFLSDGVRQEIGLYRQDKDPKYFEWIEGAIRWKGLFQSITLYSINLGVVVVRLCNCLYIEYRILAVQLLGMCLKYN